MTVRETGVAPAGVPRFNIFASPIGPQIYLEAPGEGGGGDPAPTPAPKVDPAPTPAPGGTSDEVAKLLKENMKQKELLGTLQGQLKAFEGLDPEAVRKLVADHAAAEEKRKADELALAEARGDFERVKQSMGEAHKTELEKAQAGVTTVQGQLDAALSTINELTVGASFSNSQFIQESLVLPPSVARKEFGDHFDVVDGKPVAFDKPKGAKDRTMLVDGQGKPLPFEVAIEKLVDAHPDKERLRKGKMAPGAGSKTTDNTKIPPLAGDTDLKGAARIQAILAARRKA